MLIKAFRVIFVLVLTRDGDKVGHLKHRHIKVHKVKKLESDKLRRHFRKCPSLSSAFNVKARLFWYCKGL